MVFGVAAIASVLLLGQTGATPPPTPPPRQFDTTILPPAPPAGPDRSRGVRPRGNPGLWVTSEDYPPRALREEREGLVTLQLGISSSGRAITCGVRLSSGSADLDEAACANITRRARFDPALDSNGVPEIGRWPIAVRWAIPGDDDNGGVPSDTPPATATRATQKPWINVNGRGQITDPVPQPLPALLNEPGALAISAEFRPPAPRPGDRLGRMQAVRVIWMLRLVVDGQGRVNSCAVTSASLDPAFDALLCRRYAEQVRFLPARDDTGRAVSSWTYATWYLPVAPTPSPVP